MTRRRIIRAVDLFAGAGGASNGLVEACRELGVELELLAINHWQTAVDTHSVNHPNVVHLCESIEAVDPQQKEFIDKRTGRVFKNTGRLNLMLAGPECTHFSTARGGRPVNPQSRASAWHILKWVQELYIDTILIENVPEFRTWGPIGANQKPLKSRKGETYHAFLSALRSLGYKVEDRILNAADFGDPTTRRRLFIMASRGRHNVSWPEPTHSRSGAATLFKNVAPWTTAREQVIDWSLKGKSIFTRKKALRPATMARIIAGLEKFGGPELKPFLIVLRNHVSAMSVDEPISTVTGAGTHHALVQPQANGNSSLVAMEHGGRELNPDAPLPTITTAKGDAFGVAAATLVHTTHGGARQPENPDEPIPTITGAHRGELGLAEAFVLGQQSGSVLRPVDEPVPTVASGGAISLVETEVRPVQEGAIIVDAGFGEGSGKTARRGQGYYSPDEPLGVVPCSNRFAVAEPVIVPFLGEREGQKPRTHSVDEPLQTVTTRNPIGIAEAFIVPQARFDQDEPRVDSVDDPLRTITAAGGRCFGLAQPSLVKYYGNETGAQSVDEPVDTLTTKDRHALVEPFLIAAGGPIGQGRNATGVDEPVPTVLTENHRALVEPFIISAGGPEVGAIPVSQPANTVLTRDHMGLVEPFVMKTSHAGANGKYVRSVEDPIGTVTSEVEHALVEPFISVQKNNSAPQSVDEPIPTVCTTGQGHMALIEPYVLANNTNNVAQSVDGPVPTVTGANRLALVQPIINGYALDIHFRMLQPHELAAAMSFPKEYEFTGTREAVVKQIGNAWAGRLATALCRSAVTNLFPVSKKRQKKAA